MALEMYDLPRAGSPTIAMQMRSSMTVCGLMWNICVLERERMRSRSAASSKPRRRSHARAPWELSVPTGLSASGGANPPGSAVVIDSAAGVSTSVVGAALRLLSWRPCPCPWACSVSACFSQWS